MANCFIVMRADALYQWRDGAKMNIKWTGNSDWELGEFDLWIGGENPKTLLSQLNLPELVATLFNVNVISPPQRTRSQRK